MTIGLGCIGCGVIFSWRHKPALQSLKKEFDVKIVCDARRNYARMAAKDLNCDWTTDFYDVVERKDVEAIGLYTPPTVRLDPIKGICKAGKDLYCEKPLAIKMEEAKEIRRIVEKSGIVFTTEFVRRFFPAIPKLKELLRENEARIMLSRSYGSPMGEKQWENWMFDAKRSGGYMMDFGVHLVDLSRYLLRKKATAATMCGSLTVNTGLLSGYGTSDYETLIIEFEESKIGQIEVHRFLKKEWLTSLNKEDQMPLVHYPFEIATENSMIFTNLNQIVWYDSEGKHEYTAPSMKEPIGVTLNRNFHRFITEGDHPNPDIEDAYAAVEIVFAGIRSMKRRRQVRLPL